MSTLKDRVQLPTYGQIPFYKKYEILNSVSVPDLDAIKAHQLERIKWYSEEAEKKASSIKGLNALLTDNRINSLEGFFVNEEQQTLQQVATNITSTVHALRTYSYNGTDKKYKDAKKKVELLIAQLHALEEKGKSNSPIYFSEIKKLENLFKESMDKDASFSAVQQWIKTWTHSQGDLLEWAGTTWFNARIPSDLQLKAFNTGFLSYSTAKSSGAKSKYGSGGLLQDVIVLDMKKVDLNKDIEVVYYIIDQDITSLTPEEIRKLPRVKKTKKLGEFLDYISTYNNSHGQIQIDDTAIEKLVGELSAFNVQAKSGFNQKLWNVNASTSISLLELVGTAYNNAGLSVAQTFVRLNELDREPPDDKWLENFSPDYDAIANYGLADIVHKIMHLDQGFGNQYALSPEGFTTYYQRMQTLLRSKKKIIQLQTSINIHDPFTKKYGVILTGDKY